MRTAFHPNVERCENLTLLSTMAPGAIAQHSDATVAAPLSLSLTTDQSTYTVGQPVQLTLTATNTSQSAVSFDAGPSNKGFLISQNGSVVWQSNAGMQPMFMQYVTLQPGQSCTRSTPLLGWSSEQFFR